MSERKTALTFEEKITAAFMHYVRQISQQDIAIMMGGVNAGRVNEACLEVRQALAPNRGLQSLTGFHEQRQALDKIDYPKATQP